MTLTPHARPPLPPVSAPGRALPAGAWDCHAHVFGPFDAFPLDPACRYTPPLATASDHMAMLAEVGFEHAVLVHASACGYDNRGTLAAGGRPNGSVRSIGVVAADTTTEAMRSLHERGMRGLRFTRTGPRTSDDPWPGVLDLSEFALVAPKLAEIGWMAQMFSPCATIVAMSGALLAAGIPVVFDHMGHPETALGVEGAAFRSFLDLLRDGPFYVKLTPGRLSADYPAYADVRPFHDALIEAVPDRLIFGSDWPFLGQSSRRPDVAAMIDLFDSWTDDAALRRQVFVDTPAALFG